MESPGIEPGSSVCQTDIFPLDDDPETRTRASVSLPMEVSAMIELIVVIAIVGVLLYLLNQYVPMHSAFKTAINVIAVICLVLYVLQFFGITDFDFDRRRGDVTQTTQAEILT